MSHKPWRWSVLIFLAGCWDPEIMCITNRGCVTEQWDGLCLDAPNQKRYCAFPATDCPSEWRWFRYSGDYSNKCVDPVLLPPDGGVDSGRDGGIDAAPEDAGQGG